MNRLSNHKKAKKRCGPVVAPALKGFQLVRDAFGLLGMETQAFHEEVKNKRLAALGIDRADIQAKIAARTQARSDKDWAKADAIREELIAKKIEVLDRPEGVEWRVKLAHDDGGDDGAPAT